MKNITFSPKTVNPAELALHPYLVESGLNHQPDTLFQQMLNDTGLYERPIITENGEVLTHCAEFLAAQKNGVLELAVYEVSLTLLQLQLLVLLKHKYSQKNLLASYKTAAFLRELIDNGEAVDWLDNIDGDFNVKIAAVLGTSDSTIKRLLRVGDKAYDKLGLIQEGETSFKAVIDELNRKKMAESSKTKNEEQSPEGPHCTASPENSSDGKSEQLDTPAEMQSDDNPNSESNKQPKPMPESTDEGEINQTSTGAYSFSAGVMTVAGLGELNVSVTSGKATIKVNGEELKDVEYHEYLNREGEDGCRTDSFVMRQKGRDRFAIQIIIENPSKAA